jgi:hypothetical protein
MRWAPKSSDTATLAERAKRAMAEAQSDHRAPIFPSTEGPAHDAAKAARIFVDLLPEVSRFDRERRMASSEATPEMIRAAPDEDLATRLRMKRPK